MSRMVDTQFPQRIACCILDSAAAILADHGIAVPERVEFLQHRFDVFPGCCSALLLRDARVTNLTSGDQNCGVHEVEIQWELQYTQCMTIRDPQCLAEGDCEIESGNCRDVLRCPDFANPHQFNDDPCTAETKAQETDQISSARWALTTCLAADVKDCLCDPATAPYPDDCLEDCGPTAGCQYMRFQETVPVDGGGCAGFIVRLRSRHLIT